MNVKIARVVCSQKPSREEVTLTADFITKLKANAMLYSAGGTVELGPVAITTVSTVVFQVYTS